MSETSNRDGRPALPAAGGLLAEPKAEPLSIEEVGGEVFKYMQTLDKPRKLMIARGMAPLKPSQLLLFTYMLIADEDPVISKAAAQSFKNLPPGVIGNLFAGAIPRKVIDYAARLWFDDPAYDAAITAMCLNRNTHEFTLEFLILNGREETLEILSNNQEALKRSPSLVFAFAENKRISIATVSRVLEFARRQKLITPSDETHIIEKIVGKKSGEEIPEEEKPELPKDETGEPIFAEELVSDKAEESVRDLLEAISKNEDVEVKPAEIIEQEIKKKIDIREKIKRMSVSERLRLAMRGNMEARSILIFDAVPMVAKAVINSPRVTKIEIERWAAMRIMEEEILIEISKNKTFMRNYNVRLALIYNPHTPLNLVIKMMSTLNERDIKALSKSKAVPSAVTNIAMQKVSQAAKRRGE